MGDVSLRQGGRIYFGWWMLLFGFFLMAIGYAGVLNISSIFVVPVTSQLGISRSAFLFYTTVMMLSAVVFMKVYSVQMGKGGRHLQGIVLINALLMCAAYIGFSRATQMWHFYLCAIALGSGFAGLSTQPVSILITNWFGGQVKGRVMALAFTGSGVGGMLLAPLISAVMERYGWRQGFFVLGLLYIILLVPIGLFLEKSRPEERGFSKMGQTSLESAAGEETGLHYDQAKKTPYLWIVVAALFLIVLGSGAFISNAAAYYQECGFTQGQAAAFTGYMSGMLIIGKLACGYLCDRKGALFGTVVCFLLFALCFFMLFLLPLFPLLIWGIILSFGFGCGAITTLPPLWVTSLFGEKDYSKILGVITMASNLSVAIAGLLAARVFDLSQTYQYYWLFSACGAVGTTLLLVVAFRKKAAAVTGNPDYLL